MKINNIKCTQFAGMLGKDISFDDGVNVVFGVNESGKSTLVNLMCRTLFQKPKIDARTDKEFKKSYFPSERKGGKTAGDFIDGTITFETGDGVFKLSKEWGSVSGCRLETPDGIIGDIDKITQVLRDELMYGEGVFNEMLFPSQNFSQAALETLLDSAKKTEAKSEITNAVSRAFAQSDDISIEAIETAIDEKIAAIEGDHWDYEQEIPRKSRAGKRWSKGLGEILKAYYALEDVKLKRDNIIMYEMDADNAAALFARAEKAYEKAEKIHSEFSRFESLLDKKQIYSRQTENPRENISRLKSSQSLWPQLEEECAAAKRLQAEEKERKVLDAYNSVITLKTQIDKTEGELSSAGAVTQDDVKQANSLALRIESLERSLEGMNLLAKITLDDGYSMTIISVRTGEEIPFTADMQITEAVIIRIPGVMEMKLSEGGTDVDSITNELEKYRAEYKAILGKYEVSDGDELESKFRRAESLRMSIAELKNRLALELGEETFDTVKARAETIAVIPRELKEIRGDISSLCGGAGLENFIAAKEALISAYAGEYKSQNELSEALKRAEEEINSLLEQAKEFDNIPAEFANISNPAEYLAILKNAADKKRAERDGAYKEKSDANSRLASYRQSADFDPQELEDAQRHFDEQRSNLSHWKNIKRVFAAQKEQLDSNPMHDIAESFSQYLAMITGGRVSADFADNSTLAFGLFSNDNFVDYQKLSEGTKESVFLAFRLAVLDHLYPDGGVIVLDDPFTDMDNIRAAMSVELVKKCAEKHQVILLTCREEYIDALGGNLIRI